MERGHVNVSSPELTALDLLFYLDKAAGIDRITSVVDEVLQLQGLSDPLAEYLKTVNHFPVLLDPEKGRPLHMLTGNKWKVVVSPTVSTTTLF